MKFTLNHVTSLLCLSPKHHIDLIRPLNLVIYVGKDCHSYPLTAMLGDKVSLQEMKIAEDHLLQCIVFHIFPGTWFYQSGLFILTLTFLICLSVL